MSSATDRSRAKHRVALGGPERLESREVLSANAGLAAAFVAGPVELSIEGTECRFDAYGLPSYMAGDVSLGSDGSPSIGRYEETLAPILMDITGDGIPEFVGTTGVATFSFFVGAPHSVGVGTMTTANVSFIQGVTASGQLLVGSSGSVVASTGAFDNAQGGFTSTSVVSMYPSFEMETSIQLNVNRAVGRVLAALDWVAAEMQEFEAERETRGSHRGGKGDHHGKSSIAGDHRHHGHHHARLADHVFADIGSDDDNSKSSRDSKSHGQEHLASGLVRGRHGFNRI